MAARINVISDNKRWVWVWSLIIIAASCLPYLIAWSVAPPGYQFTGVLVNPLDGYSYLAKMRQGWQGAWLFHLSYTPEPHDGAAIFLFYLALGHIARWIGLPLIVVYHAARVLAGVALLVSLDAFVSRLSQERREQQLLFLLSSSSAGLGWLGVMMGLFPIDLWVPETFAFFSLLTNPHFPLAIACMLILLKNLLWPMSGVYGWLVPGLAGMALAIIAPFALPVVYAVFVFYLLLRVWLMRRQRLPTDRFTSVKGTFITVLSATIASFPWLAYDMLVYTSNPALAAWSQQNVTPTPPLADILIGFGLLTPLAVWGTFIALRGRNYPVLTLAGWSGLTLALAYIPMALQRRLLTGLGVALAMLAGIALRSWPRRAVVLVVVFSWLGTAFQLYVFTAGALGAAQGNVSAASLYISADEAAAMQWLLNYGEEAVVLAAPRTGSLLPGLAGVRSFYGHPFETINAATKAAQAEAFFKGELSDRDWHKLREQYTIRFVFVGPNERQLGAHCLPDDLVPVFQQGAVVIYRVP